MPSWAANPSLVARRESSDWNMMTTKMAMVAMVVIYLMQVATTPASHGKMPSKNKNTDGQSQFPICCLSLLLLQFLPKFRPIYLQILYCQILGQKEKWERGSCCLHSTNRDIFTFKFLTGNWIIILKFMVFEKHSNISHNRELLRRKHNMLPPCALCTTYIMQQGMFALKADSIHQLPTTCAYVCMGEVAAFAI